MLFVFECVAVAQGYNAKAQGACCGLIGSLVHFACLLLHHVTARAKNAVLPSVPDSTSILELITDHFGWPPFNNALGADASQILPMQLMILDGLDAALVGENALRFSAVGGFHKLMDSVLWATTIELSIEPAERFWPPVKG